MKKVLSLLIIIILTYLFLILVGPFIYNPEIDQHPYYDGKAFMSIAHQGGNLEVPDETMEAYVYADNLGIDVLEMDVHLSADGVLVALHDEKVNRTTNGTGYVREMTIKQIKKLNAAYWWPYHSNTDLKKEHVPADMAFPYRDKDLKILTLEEIFQSFPGRRMIIEMKSAEEEMPVKLGDMIRKYQKENEVVVASFQSDPILRFRALYPEIATSAPEDEIRTFLILHKIGLGFLYRPAAESFQVPEESGDIYILTPSFIEEAQRKNIKIEVWTINDRDNMQRIFKMGVDGIMTDRPSLLVNID